MKDDQAMLSASLRDVELDLGFENLSQSLEELREDYSDRFFTPEGLDLLRSSGSQSE